MPRDPWPGVSVQISRRRRRCVPDPLFCLSQPGAAFIGALAPHAEVWLGPEFLNILDNWPIYHRKPELLEWPAADRHDAGAVRDALRIWQRLRDSAGHVGGPLCWVRDALRESCLPQGVDETIVPRFEALAEALDERLAASTYRSGPMVAALRDTVALASVLPGAVVLALCPPEEPWQAPLLCRHLRAWELPCTRVDEGGAVAARDREMLVDLVAEAGLSGFLWSGLHIAVVHFVVPGRDRFLPSDPLIPGDAAPSFLPEEEPGRVKGPWDDAHAFWYELSADIAHAHA